MSWAILGFQVTILVTTVLAALFGQGWRRLVFWGWLLFTLFGSIFTAGLMLLQLATVFGSNSIAKKLFGVSALPQYQDRMDGIQGGPKAVRTPQDAEVALRANTQMVAEKKGDGIWLWAVGIICAGLLWLWMSSFEPAPKAIAVAQSSPSTPLPAEAATDTDANPESVSSKNRERPVEISGETTQARRMQQAAKPVKDNSQKKALVIERESTPVARYEADRLKHACAPDEVRKYNWRTNQNECTSAMNSRQ